VNAVYYNKIQEVPAGPERDAFVEKLRNEYREDVNLTKLASELVVDEIVTFEGLRGELARRFDLYSQRSEARPPKKHIVPPM